MEKDGRVKYARCDLYYGPTFEQLLSLLHWDGLGRNTSGDHTTGARFLVAKRDYEIKVKEVPQVGEHGRSAVGPGLKKVLICDETGAISKSSLSLDRYLSDLEEKSGLKGDIEAVPTLQSAGSIRYEVGPDQNPDGIIFAPGGIYNSQKVLVCGHIGTLMNSRESLDLYNSFVRAVTEGFQAIGSYRVGPEAVRLMDEGYRLVTIGLASPPEYDLRR